MFFPATTIKYSSLAIAASVLGHLDRLSFPLPSAVSSFSVLSVSTNSLGGSFLFVDAIEEPAGNWTAGTPGELSLGSTGLFSSMFSCVGGC